MLHQVVLGFLVTVATSQAQDEFEPLDPFCLQSAKLLICSKYHRLVIYSKYLGTAKDLMLQHNCILTFTES